MSAQYYHSSTSRWVPIDLHSDISIVITNSSAYGLAELRFDVLDSTYLGATVKVLYAIKD